MQKDWTHDTISITDEIELFYTRTGNGDKPPIVLAHGITDNGLCWHQFASDMEADYDLIMYDAYGHGKSSRIDSAIRFDLSENLFDLITALKLNKPSILGHSMGAATVAAFAASHPEIPSTVVLEDPPWTDQKVSKAAMKLTMQEWKQRNLKNKQKTVKELVKLKKKKSPNWEEAILEEWAQSKHDIDPEFFDHFPENPKKWRDLAKAIRVPTLIVTGDHDLGAIVTPKLGLEAVKLLEKGEFGHISSAGHCVRYEQYRPYHIMIKIFLKRSMPV
ncbi:MAG: alpha/beta hydrolase [Chloroflexota bacterium]|nr:alpha/beta hydrolase [Chloroflexota bacterium]